jgi:hypothetical protein
MQHYAEIKTKEAAFSGSLFFEDNRVDKTVERVLAGIFVSRLNEYEVYINISNMSNRLITPRDSHFGRLLLKKLRRASNVLHIIEQNKNPSYGCAILNLY